MTPVSYRVKMARKFPPILHCLQVWKLKIYLSLSLYTVDLKTKRLLGYNAEVRFLANRGYAVLQPNLRASGGYGKIP
ncbi:MAG: hypothetical protein IPG79_18625 [Saprospiraceae bacterium]|nr:hypothetical protein [Saprospiraceae bacterium]